MNRIIFNSILLASTLSWHLPCMYYYWGKVGCCWVEGTFVTVSALSLKMTWRGTEAGKVLTLLHAFYILRQNSLGHLAPCSLFQFTVSSGEQREGLQWVVHVYCPKHRPLPVAWKQYHAKVDGKRQEKSTVFKSGQVGKNSDKEKEVLVGVFESKGCVKSSSRRSGREQ